MGRGRHRFLKEMSEALGLPRTAQRIIDVLARTRAHLSVPEISERIRASERAVRQNLRLLLTRGLLNRTSVLTTQRKSAYAYSLRSVEQILMAARKDFRRTVRRLEGVAGRLRRVRA